MRMFCIEVAAFGRQWEYDVNAPLDWVGSGVYDVVHECHQEAYCVVVAKTLESALRLVGKWFDEFDNEWCTVVDSVYYDPATVTSEECDGDVEEVVEWNIGEAKEGLDAPDRYSKVAA